MSASAPPCRGRKPLEQAQIDARRAQVLEAAADCFRRSGFHSASMAAISKAAGMSTGHIYHYFENKEAIIAALVERDSDELNDVLNSFRAQSDFLQAMIDGVDEGLARANRQDRAALKMEILAEAARNPKIASMLRDADRRALDGFCSSLRAAYAARGADDACDLEAKVVLVGALFNGLIGRTVFSPTRDCPALAKTMRRAIAAILSDDDGAATAAVPR
ncbi:MAG: TetR/AcrR family transcriptional regulator [Nevskiales bacterium]|nr:TetR/AcrR family transcriptional regulator [Nevskiales bacterium]